MREDRVTAFGGIVGRVLVDATSPGTAITAFILGAVVLAVSFIFSFIGNPGLAQLLVQIVISIALARFALNGMSGEFRGTILSTAGGSWPIAILVALRYLAISLVALVPPAVILTIAFASAMSASTAHVDLNGGDGGAALGAPPAGASLSPFVLPPILIALTSKPVIASIVFLLLALTVTPPIALIISVRAETFGAIFSKELWVGTFRGRLGDLYVVYSIHAGGLGMIIVGAIPIVLFGFSAQMEFGVLFLGAAVAYMGALAVTLLGRLCGFFAFGDEYAAPGLQLTPSPALGRIEAPPVVVGFSPRVVPGGASASDAPTAQADASAPAGAGEASPEEPPDEKGRPPLLDGEARAAAARALFATDPDAALADLIALRDQHAANVHVLHALALSFNEAGRAAESLETARAGIPLGLARGQVALAADLFVAHWKQARALGLDHGQIDAVAGALLKRNDLVKAVAAYGLALTLDPADRKAVKGLLQAADQRLHKEGRPKDAARIYTFLLQYAPNSPLADDMKRGLAEAEARVARAS